MEQLRLVLMIVDYPILVFYIGFIKPWLLMLHTLIENHEGYAEENIPQQAQSIISITPSQWEEISRRWNLSDPLVGHRS